jgi:hypothetical protein
MSIDKGKRVRAIDVRANLSSIGWKSELANYTVYVAFSVVLALQGAYFLNMKLHRFRSH